MGTSPILVDVDGYGYEREPYNLIVRQVAGISGLEVDLHFVWTEIILPNIRTARDVLSNC